MKCLVCNKEVALPDNFVDNTIPDAQLCLDCWSEFRYGKYPDSYYSNFEKVEDEYNYIGMYPHYERKIK